MTDLGELKRLLKICRAQGVTEIEFDQVKLKFGDMPETTQADSTDDKIAEQITDEDLAFYSVNGVVSQ